MDLGLGFSVLATPPSPVVSFLLDEHYETLGCILGGGVINLKKK